VSKDDLVTFEVSARLNGKTVLQHISGTDAEMVDGKLIIKRGRKKVAEFKPDQWVEFRQIP
jgi:hypothetical protein